MVAVRQFFVTNALRLKVRVNVMVIADGRKVLPLVSIGIIAQTVTKIVSFGRPWDIAMESMENG